MTIWLMRIACSVQKVTNTHSEHVTLIAFPPQQWLDERASVLTFYVHPLVPKNEMKMDVTPISVFLTTHFLWLSQ